MASSAREYEGTFDKAPIRALFLTLFGVTAPVMLVGTALFFARRRLTPIRGRSLSLVLALAIVLFSYLCFICFQWLFQPYGYSCAVGFVFGQVHNMTAAVLFVARCARLWFKARLAQEIALEQKTRKAQLHESQLRSNNTGGSGGTPQRQLRYYRGSPGHGTRALPVGASANDSPQQGSRNTSTASAPRYLDKPSGAPAQPKAASELRQASLQTFLQTETLAELNAKSSGNTLAVPTGPYATDAVIISEPANPQRSRHVSIQSESDADSEVIKNLPGLPGPEDKPDFVPGGRSPLSSHRPSLTKGRKSQLFAFQSAEADAVATESSKASDDTGFSLHTDHLWFLRHRYLITPPFVFGFVLLFLILILVIPELLVALIAGIPNDEPHCTSVANSQYITISVILMIIVICLAGWKVRLVDESFGIKLELSICGLGAIISIMIYAIAIFALDRFSTDTFPLYSIASLEAIYVVFAASVLYPVALTYKKIQPVIALEVGASKYSLLDLLNDPEGAEVFAEHLRKEFSLENLVFWESVEDFRTIANEADSDDFTRRDMALQIFHACIESGSPYEVNIPYVIKAPIKDTLFPPERKVRFNPRPTTIQGVGSPEASQVPRVDSFNVIAPDFFNEAQKCIFSLMASDSFLRFTLTDAFVQYCKARQFREANKTEGAILTIGVSQPPLSPIPATPSVVDSTLATPAPSSHNQLAYPYISGPGNSRSDLTLPPSSSRPTGLQRINSFTATTASGNDSAGTISGLGAPTSVTVSVEDANWTKNLPQRDFAESVVADLPPSTVNVELQMQALASDGDYVPRSHRSRSLLNRSVTPTPQPVRSPSGGSNHYDDEDDDDDKTQV